jgi:hypothetical protein
MFIKEPPKKQKSEKVINLLLYYIIGIMYVKPLIKIKKEFGKIKKMKKIKF